MFAIPEIDAVSTDFQFSHFVSGYQDKRDMLVNQMDEKINHVRKGEFDEMVLNVKREWLENHVFDYNKPRPSI